MFRQLPLHDRKNVRLVCRRFHDICTRWCFIQNEKFVFRRGCVDSASIVDLLLGCNYSACNFEFVRVPMNELPMSRFPSSDSQKIRHLTLNECSFSLKTITEIITYCCDLQYLKIVFNDDTKALRKTLNLLKLGTIFTELISQNIHRTSLTEFELVIEQHLKDKRFPWNAIIASILTVFPNLKSLVCLGSCVSFTFKPNLELEKLLRRSKLEVFRFNVAVDNLWFEKITRFPNLRRVQSEPIMCIFRCPELVILILHFYISFRLRKISVVQTCGENLISWLRCFENQSELTELNLTLWHYVSQAHLESFFIGAVKNCDNLRRLRVQEWLCTDISMQFTPEILNLLLNSRLESVDLPFDDTALTKGSIERPVKPWIVNTTLQTLILRGGSEEGSYAPIFEYFTNLRHLEVTFVNDVTLQAIFKHEVTIVLSIF